MIIHEFNISTQKIINYKLIKVKEDIKLLLV